MVTASPFVIQGLKATQPEYMVAIALNKLKIDYTFQSPFFGGKQETGGSVADFYIPSLSIIISVLGMYWHYNLGKTDKDITQSKRMLNTYGYRTIWIDEDDALTNADYYVSEALKGHDLSQLARN